MVTISSIVVRASFQCYILLCALSLTNANRKPHIIVIVADDLGWNDVSFHGSQQIPTPHIDRLAHGGIILNNYYVCPICTPSRSALMTGLHPIHTGLQHGVIKGDQPYGLPLNFTILPQYLKDLGYATHAVGKWHLGFHRKEYTPYYRGFDSHFGYWCGHGDYYDHTSQDGIAWGLDLHTNLATIDNAYHKYSTELFSEQAVHIINQHNVSQPIFLYLAYQAVHSGNQYSPLQAPPNYVSRFPDIEDKNRRIFAGMVSSLDDGVGAVVQALRRKRMMKHSVIVFTTDNGGPAAGFDSNAASNWPLRGVKHTLWEGGVRGTAMLWSKRLRKRARISNQLMHITDWLPTLLHVAGGDIERLECVDGYNMWSTLSRGTQSLRTEVLLNIDPISNSSGLIVGEYKIIGGKQFDGHWDGWYGPSGRHQTPDWKSNHDSASTGDGKVPTADVNCGPRPKNASVNCHPEIDYCVFNLEEDPCEYNNLANSMPDVKKFLLERLQEYAQTSVQPVNKPSDPKSDPKFYNYNWVNWKDYKQN